MLDFSSNTIRVAVLSDCTNYEVSPQLDFCFCFFNGTLGPVLHIEIECLLGGS